MNNFLNSFLGKPQDRHGIITPKSEDEIVKSRRGFLRISSGIVGAALLPSTDLFAAEFQPKNKTDLAALGAFLNGKKLTHQNADSVRIFNDQDILEQRYQSGKFEYYKPKNPENSKYRKDFLVKAKSFNKNIKSYDEALADQGYEIVKTNDRTDFVFIAEIERAGGNDSLYSNGMVIIEKGTSIVRKKLSELDKNGKPIFQNFIYDCFNPVYAMACLKK